ncbi:hypothetical protein BCIN_08g03750 [Botrytis cinerea B05.10]|uniref:Uncharacterized protein n=1 Tax=Botryotinia fuckeliana (strain B05.10) TaxID=332648 RepID=A0A384JQF6_BOTFB|nr:hypothetical protein BCIN_08g03750 [Botrytis cinerea B05.10]ATZ52732.1 hypothetical protein BCIN_08g03750 [Botrytis cinerea B05.10]
MSMEFGNVQSAAIEGATFTFNLDDASSQKQKNGTPLKPCLRTDCVAHRTKQTQLEWELKEARMLVQQKEEQVSTTVAQLESYDQRLQAAHIDLAAFEPIVAKLEAGYIEEKRKNETFTALQERFIQEQRNLEARYTAEKKKRTVEYDNLREKHFDLQDKMADSKRNDAATILELEKQIEKLENLVSEKEKYIIYVENQMNGREAECLNRDQRCEAIEQENRDLKHEIQEAENYMTEMQTRHDDAQADYEKLSFEFAAYKDEMAVHISKNERLIQRVAVEKQKLEDFRNDARAIQKESKRVQEELVQKEQETQELLEKIEKVNKELVAEGGAGVSPEAQKLMSEYVQMCRNVIQQIVDARKAQEPGFNPAPGTYEPNDGDSGKNSTAGSSAASESSSSSSSEDEVEDEAGEGGEGEGEGEGGVEGEGIPDLQVINKKTRRRGHGPDAGPKVEIRIQEVEVIREVYIPGPEIMVPGPIQYVDREVPVPGPITQVDVPGADIPGPIRYTPFRVFAHNPVICWLLVEFNFLILFFHWCKHLLALLSWVPAKITGRDPWDISPPDDDPNSEESEASDGSGAGDVDKPPRVGPKLLSVLFNPKRGRLPNAWDTFWGLVFHAVFYSALWLFLAVAYERKIWVAENDSTRRWLYQIIVQRGGSGFLGMNQILPQRVVRLLDIWRFELVELMGYPVAYQFPG